MKTATLMSVDDLLKLYDKKFRDVSFSDTNGMAYEPIYYFISNEGKRIRPLLVMAACDMFGGEVTKALYPAFGLQMFHNFTLVHDDIIDKADLRRGQPSVHAKFGENSAIISGDIMMIYAYDYLSRVDEDVLREVLTNFNKTAGQILEGQQMDIDFETRNDVSENEYLRMIEYKTSVLLGESLRLGSIIANASSENKELIYNFGLNLGLSFQIKDDWLDAFGAGEKFGKKIGGDIIQNKKTILFVKALELAGESTKEEILSLMGLADPDEKIERMLSIYRELGVDNMVRDQMARYFDDGLAFLDKISLGNERKQSLLEFAHSIYNRDH
jgi:geranylgeranyl diphosphate synthase type II